MSGDDFDYSDVPVPQDGDAHSKLRELVRKTANAEREVKTAEAVVEAAKEGYARYRDDLLPNHMRTMGITEIKVDGFDVTAGPELVGALPKDAVERAHAIAWLDANGYAGAVERTLTITLARGATNLAAMIEAEAYRVVNLYNETRGPKEDPASIQVQPELDVHHSRLKALARERIRRGLATPLKRLGLTSLTRAKLKTAK